MKTQPIDIEGFRGIEKEEFGIFNENPERFLDKPGVTPFPDPREPIRTYYSKPEAITARDQINRRRLDFLASRGIDRGLVTIKTRMVVYYKWT